MLLWMLSLLFQVWPYVCEILMLLILPLSTILTTVLIFAKWEYRAVQVCFSFLLNVFLFIMDIFRHAQKLRGWSMDPIYLTPGCISYGQPGFICISLFLPVLFIRNSKTLCQFNCDCLHQVCFFALNVNKVPEMGLRIGGLQK